MDFMTFAGIPRRAIQQRPLPIELERRFSSLGQGDFLLNGQDSEMSREI